MRSPPALALLALGLLLTSAAPGSAQSSLRLFGTAGRVVPIGGFVDGANREGRPIRATGALRTELAWVWSDARLRDPEFGVGVGRWGFDDSRELGSATTVEGFVRLPLVDRVRHALTFDAALGVAVGWNAFDPVDNPKQVVIGSPVTATFRLGATWVLRAGPAEFGLSGAYRHFSNGNLRQPNVGLNAMTVSAVGGWRIASAARGASDEGARGGRGGAVAVSGASADGRSARGWREWLLFGGARGIAADNRHTEQDDRDERQLLPVAGLHWRAGRPVSRLWDLVVGVTATWDASGVRDHQVPEIRDRPLDPEAAFSLGVTLSGLLHTGPADLEFGVGVAPVDIGGARGTSRWFQRLGIHLVPEHRISPSIVLRALNFDRPNFIEWGVRVR